MEWKEKGKEGKGKIEKWEGVPGKDIKLVATYIYTNLYLSK